MTTQQTSAELRHRALGLLDTHGWIQGWVGSPNSGFSTVGALREASRAEIVDWDCYLGTIAGLAHRICGREQLPRDMAEWVIDTWNNQKGRTPTDIRELLYEHADGVSS